MSRIVAFSLVFLFGATLAHAERRVALVIGNSDYQHVAELKNPHNDAIGMAQKLEGLDFEVVEGLNLDLLGMRRKTKEFLSKLNGVDIALFYYAGHGLQVDGVNYLIPTDAALKSHFDLEFEAVPINLVLRRMEQASKTNLVILDACRDNPLAENLARSMGTRSTAVGRGLAKTSSGIGTLISFATQPGNIALDGEGTNSPFTTALLEHLGTPGRDITRDLVAVRRDVLDATNGLQVPWENSSLTGDVILKPIERPKPVIVEKPVLPAKDPKIELEYWDSIKSGENIAYFENYLKRYPEGQFTDIALVRIEDLKSKAAKGAEQRDRTDKAAEIAFWQSIESLQNPRAFESYVARYPNGTYIDLARLKLDIIKTNKTKAGQSNNDRIPAPMREKEAKTGADQPSDGLDEFAGLSSSVDEYKSEVEREAQRKTEQERAEQEKRQKVASLSPALETSPLTGRSLNQAVQRELNRVGCSVGNADGVWGKNSQRGLSDFAKVSGLNTGAPQPTMELLQLLTAEEQRVCGFDLGNSNGIYYLTRHARKKSCGWTYLTSTVYFKNGKISDGNRSMVNVKGNFFSGEVTAEGKLKITHRWKDARSKGTNWLSGKMNSNSFGSGNWGHVGGSCGGTFTIER